MVMRLWTLGGEDIVAVGGMASTEFTIFRI